MTIEPAILDTLRYGLSLLEARARQKPHAQRMTDGERATLAARIHTWQAVIDALATGRDIPRHLWTEARFMEAWATAHVDMEAKRITHAEFLTICKRLHEARTSAGLEAA